MTNSELESWFDDIFWPVYSALVKTPFVTKYGTGNKGAAKKECLRIDPSADLRQRILLSLEAQIRHRRALYDKIGSMDAYVKATDRNIFYCNRHARTWLCQMGWDDEIPSIMEYSQELKVGAQCKHCESTVFGPKFDVCEYHLDWANGKLSTRNADILRDEYIAHPERKTWTREQHVEFMRKKARAINAKV